MTKAEQDVIDAAIDNAKAWRAFCECDEPSSDNPLCMATVVANDVLREASYRLLEERINSSVAVKVDASCNEG